MLVPAPRTAIFGMYKHTLGVQGKVAVCVRGRGRHTAQHWVGVDLDHASDAALYFVLQVDE